MTSKHQQIDPVTIIGLGLILMPLLTMCHEIGGHAAACVLTGGTVKTIGAFYIDCDSATLSTRRIVACAGPFADVCLATIGWAIWRRMRGDMARLVLWLIAMTTGFVAAGYFFFSGISGYGDLGPGVDGLGPMTHPIAWRIAIGLFGALVYWWLIVRGIRTLTAMLGDSEATNPGRKRIAHLYYVTIGLASVLAGLLNPVGLVITIMSALASSFGGNAGFISIGYAGAHGDELRPFVIGRHWALFAAGAVVSLAFAIVLGPSITVH